MSYLDKNIYYFESKYLKYKKKYLTQKKKYIQKGGLLDIVKIIKQRSVLFNFSPSYRLYGDLLLNIIKNELIARRVTTFLNSGTTKFVYNTEDEELVVKVIIIDENIFDRMIKEPIEMINNINCNTPVNIKVISTNNKIIENVENINYDIGTYCVIIWNEEKAICTELDNFPIEVMLKANKWFETTSRELEKKQFGDLGKVNVGYFKSEPQFRWIDIQPI
jgi:hypothetical protein